MKRFLSILAVALLGAVPALAATYPTFEFDRNASSINITGSNNDLTADFNNSFATSWTPTSANGSWEIDNFIDWTYASDSWAYAGSYDVTVQLAFSAPDPTSTTANGDAGIISLFGYVVGGVLTWGNTPDLEFAQGSKLAVDMEGGIGLLLGTTTTTGVTFTGNPAAPVPLPASGLLLIGGLGGLALLRRRRNSGGISAMPA